MSLFDRVANVQNTAPGKIAIVEFPCVVTYDKIHIKMGGGLVAADLTRIEIQANGRPFYINNGPDVVKEMTYKGHPIDAAWLTIDFTNPRAKGSVMSQFAATIPANLLNSLKMFVTISGAANPAMTMEVKTEHRAPTSNPFIRKMLDFHVGLQGAGEHDLFLPSGSSGGIIQRIWFHNTGHITAWDLRVNRLSARRQVLADWEYEQGQNELVPQANLDVMDFIVDGNLQGALDTSAGKDGKVPVVELRVTTDAAETIRGYLEYIDPISRL